jgi:hypothetical protein
MKVMIWDDRVVVISIDDAKGWKLRKIVYYDSVKWGIWYHAY